MPTKLKEGERRSKNEIYFEQGLVSRGYKYSYEPGTYTIIPTKQGTLGLVSPTTYTPDYMITIGDTKIFIEVKGYARKDDLLKSKIVDVYFTNRNAKYVMVGNFGTKGTGLKDYYPYSSKKLIKRLENDAKKGKVVKKMGVLHRKYQKGSGVVEVKPCPIPKTIWDYLDEWAK